MKTVSQSSSWYFRFAKWMIRKNIRGGYRIIKMATKLGLLDTVVRYSLSDTITMHVPLYRESNQWDQFDVLNYDALTIKGIVKATDSLPEPAVFIDCGADIGIVSVLVALNASNIERFIGFEPNSVAFDILKQNYSDLPFPADVKFGGVGCFTGFGSLQSPEHEPDSDHAKFMIQDENGEIPIFRVDDLAITPDKCVVLKIDVEGGELDVIEGALSTLSNAKQFVVIIEAHPKVASRIGMDPIVVLRRLNEIRPCRFKICELRSGSLKVRDRSDFELQLDKDFFAQVDNMNYDIIVDSQLNS